jgi:protein-L-isoaspartate(D-aspartate) O-methyltransferase
MAWRSSGSSNTALVENLWTNGMLSSPVVKAAFLRVDRAHYAPRKPYEDSPQSIGHAATISAPHMHANAVESLLPWVLPMPASASSGSTELKDGLGADISVNSDAEEQDSSSSSSSNNTKKRNFSPVPSTLQGVPGRPRRVLDVGSGSGYLTHVLAELAGPDGIVVGVEHIAALRDLGQHNMAKSPEGAALLAAGRARFRLGDGRRGWIEPSPGGAAPAVGGPTGAPAGGAGPADRTEQEGGWDAIHVGAAAVELHADLVDQLRCPGRMFIPVGGGDNRDQYIWTVDKDVDGTVTKKKLYGVRYVPLTDPPETEKKAGKEEL